MTTRREQTSHFIRDAAGRELVDRGHAALTMEGIARRSYVSVGSVYARYPNKSAVLHDIAENQVAPTIEWIGDGESTEPAGENPGSTGEVGLGAMLRAITADHGVDAAVHSLVELALASRHDQSLVDPVHGLVARFASLPRLDHPDDSLRAGMRWFVLATVFGKYVLTGAGCTIPPVWASFSRFIESLLAADGRVDRAARGAIGIDPARVASRLPESPEPRVDDDLAESLTGATREELAKSGLAGANLAAIARRSGVTTGAVYRRYRSKGELVNDTVVRELDQSRYGWTVDFVSSLVEPGSARTAGDVLAAQLSTVLADESWVLTTLEMLAAARIDPDVRDTLSTQVHNAASARARMFEDLRDLGVLHDEIDPHLLGWLIQLVPAGGRVLSAVGIPIDETHLRRSINAVVDAIV